MDSYEIVKAKKNKQKKLPKVGNRPEYVDGVRWIGMEFADFNHEGDLNEMFSIRTHIMGTGFYLKNKPFVVTCFHVIEDCIDPVNIQSPHSEHSIRSGRDRYIKNLIVGDENGHEKAVIVAIDPKHDLALLELKISEEHRKEESRCGFELAKEYPKIGERVGYCGYPISDKLCVESIQPTYAEGAAGSFVQKTKTMNKIQISGPIIGGFSGSPIFSRYKQKIVYGIAYTSAADDASGRSEIFFGAGYEHIANLARCY
jgi:S1-C subfamily serine protease